MDLHFLSKTLITEFVFNTCSALFLLFLSSCARALSFEDYSSECISEVLTASSQSFINSSQDILLEGWQSAKSLSFVEIICCRPRWYRPNFYKKKLIIACNFILDNKFRTWSLLDATCCFLLCFSICPSFCFSFHISHQLLCNYLMTFTISVL